MDKVLKMAGECYSVYPHEDLTAFARYIYDGLRQLPTWSPAFEKQVASATTNIEVVNQLLQVTERMFNDEHSLFRSMFIVWGDIGSQEKIGTVANPALLSFLVNHQATDRQQACHMQLMFLPHLAEEDPRLHDIIIQTMAILCENCSLLSFNNYADWGIEQTETTIDEIKYHHKEQKLNGTRHKEDESGDFDPNLDQLKNAVHYWKGPLMRKYRKLISRHYDSQAVRQAIAKHKFDFYQGKKVRSWLIRALDIVDSGLNAILYAHSIPELASEEVSPLEYHCMCWGIDDAVEDHFTGDIQSRWENCGFAPWRKLMTIGRDEFKFIKKGNEVIVDWGKDDKHVTGISQLMYDGCFIFHSEFMERYYYKNKKHGRRQRK